MKTCRLTTVLIFFIVWSVRCVPYRKKADTTQKFHETGEAIALDNLIEKYEGDHQKFYKEEIEDGNYLKWPVLDNKNLSNYCKEYLEHSVPTRRTANATGLKIRRTLHYRKPNMGSTSEVLVVQCKITYKFHPLIYYITRAPKPNCVYALKCSGNWTSVILTIINKYCNFENKEAINNSLKRKRKEIFGRMHHPTGQPIAKDKYLLEYELEHQELFYRKVKEGKHNEWPYASEPHNLDSFCYQYMKECSSKRNREGVTGALRTEKLHYQKLNTKNGDIDVTTVICVPFESRRRYHMTGAPQNNCVYALLRMRRCKNAPLVIIFKHCDFEDLSNQQIISQDFDRPSTERNVVPKPEIKNERVGTLGTLKLFTT